ncbi:branched-chain amino acid ABC transporter permease [Nakamurella silvestris]|nr:branched-chain amino acid ABC transporter permease [Nakamurella silvestris]
MWSAERRSVIGDAIGVGVATAAYGVPFGAIAVAGGLNLWQTMALSLLMFTGGSQFALVGVLAGGGSPFAGAATAVMLGARNMLYGLRLAPMLRVRGLGRWTSAHLVIDESAAMAFGRRTERASRLAFYSTGLSIFVLWNLGTLVGAVGADALSDPKVLGLDVAAPAAFIALLAPQVRGRAPWAIAGLAALVAVAAIPFVPAGVPVLLAAAVAVVAALLPAHLLDGRDR